LTLADLFCAQELWRSGNASYLAPISAIGGLSSETLRAAEIGKRINQLLLQTMRGEIYEAFSERVCLTS
ncbi:hypothetical protein KC571_04010, partial [candidate division WWE3 bacterium]|nr:hypothetical protein [candidate division WWE3 bacterium]